MNGVPFLLLIFPVIFSLIAIYTDLKERMIYDWLNYSSIIVSAIIAIIFKLNLIGFAIFTIIGFLFSYLIYKMGGWAGGDVKFFTAMCAWFALFNSNLIYIIFIFIISAILIVPVAIAVYWKKIFENRKYVFQKVDSSLQNAFWAAFAAGIGASVYRYSPIYSLVVGLFASVLIIKNLKLPLFVLAIASAYLSWELFLTGFIVGALITFITSILIGSFLVLSPKVLRTSKKIEELKEGDIPYSSIYLNDAGKVEYWIPPSLNKMLMLATKLDKNGLERISPPQKTIVDCLDAGGITNEQIVQLKNLKDVKEIIIKESLAYAPSIALGFLIMTLIIKF